MFLTPKVSLSPATSLNLPASMAEEMSRPRVEDGHHRHSAEDEAFGSYGDADL